MTGRPRVGLGSVALAVAGLTLASRVVGFGRSLVFSKTVGDTCLGDVYHAANSLPNVLFEIVAGGVLAGVVVPVVARHVGAGRTEAAARSASALITWTLLVLTPPALAAYLAAGAYAEVFAKTGCAGASDTLAALLVMFVPQVWLYGLAVVSAGVLQAHSRFLAAAAAPLVSSVVVIAAYLTYAGVADPGAAADLTRLSQRAVTALGVGTTLGVLALAATTGGALARLGLPLRPRLRFAPGDRRVVTAIALAGLAGLVLQQLATLEIAFFAQRSPDAGALTRFGWAYAIYLLPYAVLVAPLLQLVFPRLSTAAEQGSGELTGVLGRWVSPVTLLACLGAALLVATAVPVARVFVLGPGSGRTEALAWPIAALAPAVLGYSLLGLASRTLLAAHRARASGVTAAVAWGSVIAGALLAGLLLPDRWLVPGLAGAVSVGLVAGATCGWSLVLRTGTAGPGRALRAGVPAAVLTGGAVGWAGTALTGVSLAGAVAGALAAAVVATAVFLGLLGLLDRGALRDLWALRAALPAGRRG